MLLRSEPRPCVRLLAVLALAGSVSGHLGCGGTSGGGDRAPCSSNGDCKDGFLCQNGTCSKTCNVDRDCPSGDQRCQNGACQMVANAICAAVSDCSAPAICETTAGAECVAGACIYPPQVCDSPPPDECLANDTLYRAYPNAGSCNTATGTCAYTPVDIPCQGCTADCVTRCQGIVCDDTAGGCKSQGLCVPEDPPRCSYVAATDGTACELPSSLDGNCVAGDCAGCISGADCIDPPGGYTLCFIIACNGGVCDYTPQPNVVCEIAQCSNAVVTDERICGVDGTCPSGGTTSCGGLRCDPGGAICRASCGNDADCLSGFFCDANDACVATGVNGSPCASPSQCQSGYCANGFCCQSGVCCGQDVNCPASFSSTSTCDDPTTATDCQGTRFDARCLADVCTNEAAPDDSSCDSNEHTCANNFAPVICTAGVDQTPPVCASACVTDADCAAGHICQAPSCVLRAGTGDPCSGPGTCSSGLKCENNVCCDLAAGTCCDNDALCAGGLACDTIAATCYETCNDRDNSRCVDAADICLDNTCAAKVGLGTFCNNPTECQSNNCVDDVCCATACGGGCDRCDVTGQEGACVVDDALCTGTCDSCDPGTGDCISDVALCVGNCDQCTGSGTSFNCTADPAPICAACEICSGGGTDFSCVQDPGLSAYAAAVLCDNPVAYWRLSDSDKSAGATAYDRTGNGFDGAYFGGVTSATSLITGDADGASSFDGATGKVDVPYSSALNSSQFSAELWVTSDVSTGWHSPLTSRQGTPSEGYLFYHPDGNTPEESEAWLECDCGGDWTALGARAVTTGERVYLVMTYDGSTFSLYINGSLDSSAGRSAYAPNSNAANPLRIGAGDTDGSGSFWFDGTIDDVAIYDYALSAPQISAHYTAGW